MGSNLRWESKEKQGGGKASGMMEAKGKQGEEEKAGEAREEGKASEEGKARGGRESKGRTWLPRPIAIALKGRDASRTANEIKLSKKVKR